jgi:hypothetical protein
MPYEKDLQLEDPGKRLQRTTRKHLLHNGNMKKKGHGKKRTDEFHLRHT